MDFMHVSIASRPLLRLLLLLTPSGALLRRMDFERISDLCAFG